MALGKQGSRSRKMFISWDEIPKSPGHAFSIGFNLGLLMTHLIGYGTPKGAVGAWSPVFVKVQTEFA